MKKLILQIYCDINKYSEPYRMSSHDEIKDLSSLLAKKYAQKCKADYRLLDDIYINFRHPTYERFRLWSEKKWLDEYDRVLYIDTDVFCWPDSPDIFSMFPDDRFKVARHWSWKESTNPLQELQGDFKGYKHKDLNDISFNAGMFLLSKKSRDVMLPYLDFKNSREQSDDSKILHRLILDSKVNLEIIDRKWNAKNMSKDLAYFTHLWGNAKHKNPNMVPIQEARKIYNEFTTTI